MDSERRNTVLSIFVDRSDCPHRSDGEFHRFEVTKNWSFSLSRSIRPSPSIWKWVGSMWNEKKFIFLSIYIKETVFFDLLVSLIDSKDLKIDYSRYPGRRDRLNRPNGEFHRFKLTENWFFSLQIDGTGCIGQMVSQICSKDRGSGLFSLSLDLWDRFIRANDEFHRFVVSKKWFFSFSRSIRPSSSNRW